MRGGDAGGGWGMSKAAERVAHVLEIFAQAGTPLTVRQVWERWTASEQMRDVRAALQDTAFVRVGRLRGSGRPANIYQPAGWPKVEGGQA